MFWCVAYLAVAAVVALTTFVSGDWIRSENVAAPEHPGTLSALAGMLWPVLIFGMTELVLVTRFGRGPRYEEPHELTLTG